ncbi:hypothetical protein Tco_1136991, partial [Tanacetum coccineum]
MVDSQSIEFLVEAWRMMFIALMSQSAGMASTGVQFKHDSLCLVNSYLNGKQMIQAIQDHSSWSFLKTSTGCCLIVVKLLRKWLRVQQMMKGSDIGIQEKKAKLFNEWERFTSTDGNRLSLTIIIAQPGMNMGQDRQMRMVGANGGNQFRLYAGQNVGYQNGYNAVQNVENQVAQDAVQNQGVQNVGNQNGQIVVPGITNQNPNGNGNIVAARAEGNAIGNNVRPRRRDAAYLQTQLLIAQKEEAGIQLQAEEFDLMAAAA